MVSQFKTIRGFTYIEALVMVAIVGIILAMVFVFVKDMNWGQECMRSHVETRNKKVMVEDYWTGIPTEIETAETYEVKVCDQWADKK